MKHCDGRWACACVISEEGNEKLELQVCSRTWVPQPLQPGRLCCSPTTVPHQSLAEASLELGSDCSLQYQSSWIKFAVSKTLYCGTLYCTLLPVKIRICPLPCPL